MPSTTAAQRGPARRANTIQPEDLYSLRQCFACTLSPDGRLVALLIDGVNREENKKFANIWVQPVNPKTGKAAGPLRRFTQGEFADGQPRFSPDGKWLAFTSNRSGKGQLHLIPVDGGESFALTKLKGSVGAYAWSPDSKRIVFSFSPQDEDAIERETLVKQGKKDAAAPAVREIERIQYRLDGAGWLPKSRSELHLVDVPSGKTRLLLKDGKDNGEPSFSPDGKWVVFSSNKSDDPDLDYMQSKLWKIRADGKGRALHIPTFEGPSFNPSVSPDGKWIAFRGWADPAKRWNESDDKLWVVPFGGGAPRQLGEKLDRPVDSSCINDTWGTPATPPPLWCLKSKHVFTVVTTDGTTQLWRFDAATGEGFAVWEHPGVLLDFAVDMPGKNFYATFSTQYNPGDLYSAKWTPDGRAGEPVQLTRLNAGWLARKALGEVHEQWLKGAGGHRLHGWVLTPPGFNPRRKYPAILYIHGGPAAAYASSYFHEFQYLAGQGFIVMYSNPRGSTGYGLKHKAAIAKGWGKEDYSDLLRFTDHCLAAFPSIDPARVGVAGGSYGGYMTNWIIGHTQRFKAAVSDRCVSNWLSMFGSSDFGWHFVESMGYPRQSPFEALDKFVEISPIAHLHKAKTPTLIIHQENDLRCQIEQAEQVFTVLKLKGVKTKFLRYPDESHGMSRGGRSDRRIHRLKAISGWFRENL